MALDPVAGHFNEVADVYDEVIPFFSEFAAQFDQRILWPDPPAAVLDLGAGRGAMTTRALEHGCHVVAVDAAPRMVELLRRDLPSVEAHVMSADSLDLPDESFDLVVASFMIHIVPRPEATVGTATTPTSASCQGTGECRDSSGTRWTSPCLCRTATPTGGG